MEEVFGQSPQKGGLYGFTRRMIASLTGTPSLDNRQLNGDEENALSSPLSYTPMRAPVNRYYNSQQYPQQVYQQPPPPQQQQAYGLTGVSSVAVVVDRSGSSFAGPNQPANPLFPSHPAMLSSAHLGSPLQQQQKQEPIVCASPVKKLVKMPSETVVESTQAVDTDKFDEGILATNEPAEKLAAMSLTSNIMFDDGEVSFAPQQHSAAMMPRLEARPASAHLSPEKRMSPTLMPMSQQSVQTPSGKVLAEFDPLIPQDWMIKFDSPAQRPPSTPAQNAHAQPMSLLDSLNNDFATPSSIVKFTERDIQAARRQIQDRADREMEIMQLELQAMEKKLKDSEEQRNQMKMIVDEFERTMSKMIDDSKAEKERHRIVTEKMNDERARLQNDLATVEASFKELRMRYEDMKSVTDQYRKNEMILKQTIEHIQQDVVASEQRVDAIKTHAEKKIEEANTEIERVQSVHQDELALLKAKMSKSDLKIKTLEKAVEQKQAENTELMAICDDLIQKLEAKK